MAIKKVVKKVEVEEVKSNGCGMSCKKVVLIHLGMLLMVLAALGLAYYRYWNVVEVNGQGISRLEYIKVLEAQGGKQILDGMTQEVMIMQEAKKQNYKVEQAVIDSEIAKIEEQVKAQGATLEEALTSQGMTREELVRQITLKKIVTELSKAKQEITAEQIKAFIDDNKAQLPPKATQQEMEEIAKEQIGLNAENTAITNWLAELKKNAQVVYK
jgi:hypothetical protein